MYCQNVSWDAEQTTIWENMGNKASMQVELLCQDNSSC
jgi:hypothetical protein